MAITAAAAAAIALAAKKAASAAKKKKNIKKATVSKIVSKKTNKNTVGYPGKRVRKR